MPLAYNSTYACLYYVCVCAYLHDCWSLFSFSFQVCSLFSFGVCCLFSFHAFMREDKFRQNDTHRSCEYCSCHACAEPPVTWWNSKERHSHSHPKRVRRSWVTDGIAVVYLGVRVGSGKVRVSAGFAFRWCCLLVRASIYKPIPSLFGRMETDIRNCWDDMFQQWVTPGCYRSQNDKGNGKSWVHPLSVRSTWKNKTVDDNMHGKVIWRWVFLE